MRLEVKLLIFCAAVLLLWFLPSTMAAVIQSSLLILVVGIFIVVVIAAYRDLNLLHLPILRGKTDQDSFRHVSYNGLKVYYTMKLNGGGLGLSHEFVQLVSTKIGKVKHAYEYCAGPGFIGFNLLASNLCETLTLSDVNPDAIVAINKTIKDNHLGDRVTAFQSDCLASIPENQKWDLIVSNPPWDLRLGKVTNLLLDDPSARVHKELFQNFGKYLNPGGSIVLVESHEYTSKQEFENLVEGTNLSLVEYFPPRSFLRIFGKLRDYQNISLPMAITLRLGMSLLEIYFVQIKSRDERATQSTTSHL